MKSQPLTLVIPIYNEKRSIKGLIVRLETLLKSLPEESEVCIVDDGSRDGTGKLLDAAIDKSSSHCIHLVRHRTNRGYGAALKTGIRKAAHDLIAIADADGTYPLEELPAMLEMLYKNEAEMVVGARSVSDQPALRQPPKWILRQLAQYLTGERIPDLNSGLRIFKKAAAERYWTLLPDGFSFTTTITMALLNEKSEVVFTPIEYSKRVGSSKIRPIYDTINFLMLICRTSLAFQPMKVFGPVGGLCVGIGVVLLLLRMVLPEPVGVATTITLVIGGLQILLLGFLADLINRRA